MSTTINKSIKTMATTSTVFASLAPSNYWLFAHLKKMVVEKVHCQHLNRAVDIDHIKKSLKSENLKILSCVTCTKSGDSPNKNENWICLQCGARLCGEEHLKHHFKVPRSDLHSVAFSIEGFLIWCNLCDSLISEEDSKKLKICIGFINQAMERSTVSLDAPSGKDGVAPSLVEYNESNDADCAKSNTYNDVDNFYNRPPDHRRSSVRGLVNLGNTCFFNSVLQCLARTPRLVETLRRMESEKEHISVTLKNGQRLEGCLEKSGDWLGQCLADTLVALCKPGDSSSENPLRLLQLLKKKCPQFEGYDQHDAHELLRHLLDNVRQNDLKRYRSLMLSELGLSRKVNPQDVSADLQKKVKELDNEVVERVTLVPEHVFKGLLVSTLECQDCNHTSHCVESFLDLSLPIMADKPQPPSMVRRKGSASPELVDEKAGGGMSKYQLKKQAKQAKRKARMNKHGQKFAPVAAADGTVPASLDSHSDKGESEADVEDNEEDKPHESGYSSEKIQSESSSLSGGDDSARTSPTARGKEEGGNVSSMISICEGLPVIGGCSSPPSSNLIQCPEYAAFPRVRRRPPCRWSCGLDSLQHVWTPHNDTTCIPDPAQVVEGGESWKDYVPRNGLSPNSGNVKKNSQLNSIQEESDRLKPVENNELTSVMNEPSVTDQVSLVNKMVTTVMAKVNISLEYLDKYDNKSVTTSKDLVDQKDDGGECCYSNVRLCYHEECSQAAGDCNKPNETASNRIPRYNPFNSIDSKENSPSDCNNKDFPVDNQTYSDQPRKDCVTIIVESDHSNDHVTSTSDVFKHPTDKSEMEEENQQEERVSNESVTDETSNGFHVKYMKAVNSYPLNQTEGHSQDQESYNGEDTANQPYNNENEENKSDKEKDDKGESTFNATPVFYSVEDKEESDSVQLASKGLFNRFNRQVGESEEDKDESLDIPPLLKMDSTKVEEEKPEQKKEPSGEGNTSGPRSRFRTTKFSERDYASRNQCMDSECSIQSCLSQFTAIEIMTGSNRVGCSACALRYNKGNKEGKAVYTIAAKQLLIKRAPQVLILHLKRFQVQMYSFRKLSKHVSFPLCLDLSPFCLPEVERDEDGRIMYSLYGVVEHSGNLNGGHYVAYIKVEDGDNSCKWFCVSDSYVHVVTENRVLDSQAYLLFYERINTYTDDQDDMSS